MRVFTDISSKSANQITTHDAPLITQSSSRVYASDMFSTAFSKDPMSREAGMRYRRSILEKGGSVDEMAMLTGFLGRKPDSLAFQEELGIQG
jgi:metallopeptidase MepB